MNKQATQISYFITNKATSEKSCKTMNEYSKILFNTRKSTYDERHKLHEM